MDCSMCPNLESDRRWYNLHCLSSLLPTFLHLSVLPFSANVEDGPDGTTRCYGKDCSICHTLETDLSWYNLHLFQQLIASISPISNFFLSSSSNVSRSTRNEDSRYSLLLQKVEILKCQISSLASDDDVVVVGERQIQVDQSVNLPPEKQLSPPQRLNEYIHKNNFDTNIHCKSPQ